jgi:hypothetical protein
MSGNAPHRTQSGHSPLPPLRIGFAPSFWRRVARRASHGDGHITHQNSTREKVLHHAAHEKDIGPNRAILLSPSCALGLRPASGDASRVARRASHGHGHITHHNSTREKVLRHAAYEKRHKTQSGHSPLPPLRIVFAPSFWRRVYTHVRVAAIAARGVPLRARPPLMFKCCRRRRTASTLRKWASLLRHVRRVRRLQRVFAYIDQHLNENYPDSLRRRLRVVFPTGRQAQLLG